MLKPAITIAMSLLALTVHAATPLPPVPQPIIDKAIAAPPFRCYRSAKQLQMIAGNGGAGIVLGTAAFQGNTSADAALLERIRFSLRGENTLMGAGGYWAQHERHLTAMYTLARLTPRIWNQLTPDERERIDLLMYAALVGSAFTTSDASYANDARPITLDGSNNLNRDWNPNYREGMLGMMPVAVVYFSGGTQVHKLLDTFDPVAFTARLQAAGLTNTLETFRWKQTHPDSTAPDGATIQANIRDYRCHERDLSDPMDLYYRLTINTYGGKVSAGLNDGRGIDSAGCLVSGAEQLPNPGQGGMLLEFASSDALGKRSSADYAYGGFRPNLTNHLVLLAGGYWRTGPQADECLARMEVGITDLYYKLEHGYRDYSKGKPSTRVYDLSSPPDAEMARSLWQDVIKPYHKASH